MNENIDKIKENYAEHYDKFNNASLAAFKGAKVYYDAQLSILKHFNLSDKHVLDIGTGNGHLVRYMLDQGAGRITSVEIDPTLYQRAKSVFDANQNVSIYQANIFDFSQDIYGDTIRIFWLDKIRDMVKFDNVDELVKQLQADEEIARYWIPENDNH